MSNNEITDGGLRHLRGLVKLSELELRIMPITGVGFRHLAHLKNLTSLDLSWSLHMRTHGASHLTREGFDCLGQLKSLRTITLRNAKVTDEDLKQLSGLPNLTELNLVATPISSIGLKELRALRRLRVLNLSNARLTDEGCEEIGQLDSLTELFVYGTGFTDSGLRELRRLPNLTRLGLGNRNLSIRALQDFESLRPNVDINPDPHTLDSFRLAY